VFEARRSAALRVQECGRIDRAPHDDGAPIYIPSWLPRSRVSRRRSADLHPELAAPIESFTATERRSTYCGAWEGRAAWAKGVTGTEAAIYISAVGDEGCVGQRGHGDRGRDLHFCGGRGELRGPKGSRGQRPRSTFLRWARRVAWAKGVTGTEAAIYIFAVREESCLGWRGHGD
jgi:hypothetical protein